MQPQYHPPKSVFKEASSQSYDQVFALVSGGSDSTTAAHVARANEHLDVDGVIYIDTGIGIPQSRQWVKNWANGIGLPCHVVGSQYRLEKEEYHNLVHNYGTLICSGGYFLMTGVRSLLQHGQQGDRQRGVSA